MLYDDRLQRCLFNPAFFGAACCLFSAALPLRGPLISVALSFLSVDTDLNVSKCTTVDTRMCSKIKAGGFCVSGPLFFFFSSSQIV